MSRGALIVLEGCDRAGKSTQVKMLVKALNSQGISSEARVFPDRTTPVGELIDKFLKYNKDLPPETIHLLFSANRWECSKEMINTLKNGTTLVVDRYAASGAAYTAANTGRELAWCKAPDKGLPRPDMIAFLEVAEKEQSQRGDWGAERFEHREFQRKVAANFNKLHDDTWRYIDANEDAEKIHSKLLLETLEVIAKVKHCPIEQLYEP
ncbi:thymidylate kinase [Orussus abietinus]|uniref:thymidylate kinase n=1 Tax=Orussus abietinus TaxID=222816 RepID=UPI00062591EC|nr:thymidylate kinase [Orussus abietinus]